MSHTKPWSEELKKAILETYELDKTSPSYLRNKKTGFKPHVVSSTGYYCVHLLDENKKSWARAAHAIVYFLANGKQPTMHVDHIDGNSLNNSPSNLQDISGGQNMAKGTGKTSSRYQGVQVRHGTYMTRYKGKYVGYYKTEEEAALAYDACVKSDTTRQRQTKTNKQRGLL